MFSRISFFLFFLLSIHFTAYAQVNYDDTVSYNSAEVNIDMVSCSWRNNLFFIYKYDTIRINEYAGDFIKGKLNGSFFFCEYKLRAGSGSSIKNKIVLCVDGGRLYECMNVTSFIKTSPWDPLDTNMHADKAEEGQEYKASFSYIGSCLNIHVDDKSCSASVPEDNFNVSDDVTLKFDSLQHIFYSAVVELGGSYIIVYNSPGNKQCIIDLKYGKYPLIKLGSMVYYFIKGKWFQRGRDNYLMLLSDKLG